MTLSPRKALLISFAAHLCLILLLNMLAVEKQGGGFGDGQTARLEVRIRVLPSVAEKNSGNSIALQAEAPAAPTQSTSERDKDIERAADSLPNEGRWGIELPTLEDYYPAAALTERPQVIKDIPANIGDFLPAQAEGKVILRLYISVEGLVEEVAIEETELAVADMALLVESFRHLQFRPGRLGKTSVKTEMRIEVNVTRMRSPQP